MNPQGIENRQDEPQPDQFTQKCDLAGWALFFAVMGVFIGILLR